MNAIDYSCPEECTRDAVEALQAENKKLWTSLDYQEELAKAFQKAGEKLAAENKKLRAVVECVLLDVPSMRAEIARARGYALYFREADALELAGALEALEDTDALSLG